MEHQVVTGADAGVGEVLEKYGINYIVSVDGLLRTICRSSCACQTPRRCAGLLGGLFVHLWVRNAPGMQDMLSPPDLEIGSSSAHHQGAYHYHVSRVSR